MCYHKKPATENNAGKGLQCLHCGAGKEQSVVCVCWGGGGVISDLNEET